MEAEINHSEHEIAELERRRGRYVVKCKCKRFRASANDAFEAQRLFDLHLIDEQHQEELGL